MIDDKDIEINHKIVIGQNGTDGQDAGSEQIDLGPNVSTNDASIDSRNGTVTAGNVVLTNNESEMRITIDGKTTIHISKEKE